MHLKNYILKDLKYFIKHDGFNIKNDDVESLLCVCDSKFGNNPTMLYFEYTGYNINIIIDESKFQIINQQVEIINKLILEDDFLLEFLNYSSFNSNFINNFVECIYGDDTERVLILISGPMLYYNKQSNNFILVKIIQRHRASQDLAIKLMDKIYPI